MKRKNEAEGISKISTGAVAFFLSYLLTLVSSLEICYQYSTYCSENFWLWLFLALFSTFCFDCFWPWFFGYLLAFIVIAPIITCYFLLALLLFLFFFCESYISRWVSSSYYYARFSLLRYMLCSFMALFSLVLGIITMLTLYSFFDCNRCVVILSLSLSLA